MSSPLLAQAEALRPLIESEADGIEAAATMSSPVVEAIDKAGPVSYTHLTLPTIYSV